MKQAMTNTDIMYSIRRTIKVYGYDEATSKIIQDVKPFIVYNKVKKSQKYMHR